MMIGWIYVAQPDPEALGRRLVGLARLAAQAARLMVGVRDYGTYLEHRQKFRRGEPIMNYAEFYRRCQQATYAIEKGGFRGIG
jgi:uncharacterized short protein YbdD (DUF466 family)